MKYIKNTLEFETNLMAESCTRTLVTHIIGRKSHWDTTFPDFLLTESLSSQTDNTFIIPRLKVQKVKVSIFFGLAG